MSVSGSPEAIWSSLPSWLKTFPSGWTVLITEETRHSLNNAGQEGEASLCSTGRCRLGLPRLCTTKASFERVGPKAGSASAHKMCKNGTKLRKIPCLPGVFACRCFAEQTQDSERPRGPHLESGGTWRGRDCAGTTASHTVFPSGGWRSSRFHRDVGDLPAITGRVARRKAHARALWFASLSHKSLGLRCCPE